MPAAFAPDALKVTAAPNAVGETRPKTAAKMSPFLMFPPPLRSRPVGILCSQRPWVEGLGVRSPLATLRVRSPHTHSTEPRSAPSPRDPDPPDDFLEPRLRADPVPDRVDVRVDEQTGPSFVRLLEPAEGLLAIPSGVRHGEVVLGDEPPLEQL